MSVLIDTSVWSLLLRHKATNENQAQINQIKAIVIDLIQKQQVRIIGCIRQEILSGIVHQTQFEKLEQTLNAFTDEEVVAQDYITAAQCFNQCRAKGIQGSHIDFLICAVALNHQLQILTTDKDFLSYKKVLALNMMALD